MRKHIMLAVPVLIAVGAGSAVGATAPDEPDSDGLVTEEVEPGVERIISDDAGHDLDETHPTYRYDMDDVFVTPDGTVWLSTTYSRDDNEAHPPGPLLWALGEPGMSEAPLVPCLPRPEAEGSGVICFDPATGDETVYLAGTPINAIAVAPDGTVWAVGGYDGDNGGLYRITTNLTASAATTASS